MNNRINYAPHTIAVTAIFVMGNGVIIFPLRGANEFAFTAYIISSLLLILLYSVFGFFWNKLNVDKNSVLLHKVIYSAVISGIGIFALFCGTETFSDMTNFASKIILPNTAKFFICLILAFASVYFFLKDNGCLLKFSLISIVLITVVILFFFIAAADKYDLRNIFIFRLPKTADIIPQLKSYIINPIMHSILLPVYLKNTLGKTNTKWGVWGVALGAVFLGLCILTPILLFGAGVSGGLEFPFSSAVSTVTVGRLFTRLDGFAYFVYFVCSAIKISICLTVAFKSMENINKIL